jgi:hypothetical protein
MFMLAEGILAVAQEVALAVLRCFPAWHCWLIAQLSI